MSSDIKTSFSRGSSFIYLSPRGLCEFFDDHFNEIFDHNRRAEIVLIVVLVLERNWQESSRTRTRTRRKLPQTPNTPARLGSISYERLKNEEADGDRLDEKEDSVELVIALFTCDRSRR